MSNLATLEKRAYVRLGIDNDNPGAVTIGRIRGFINETYKQIMGRKVLAPLRRQLLTTASISGTPFMAMPQVVSRIHSIADRVNNWVLEPVNLQDIRDIDPGLQLSTGNPYAYAEYNLRSPVFRQPSMTAGNLLFAKSSSVSDNATLYVQGITTTGAPLSVSKVLNGTTEVAVSATPFLIVTKMYIQVPATQGVGATATAVGVVSLYAETAGTIIGQIPVGRSVARYSIVHLYPSPSAVVTYTCDAEVLVEELVEEGDEPLLPEDYHWLLTSGAIIKEFQRREKHISVTEERIFFRDGMGDLILHVSRSPSPNWHGGVRRFSQLGPYYSPGS